MLIDESAEMETIDLVERPGLGGDDEMEGRTQQQHDGIRQRERDLFKRTKAR